MMMQIIFFEILNYMTKPVCCVECYIVFVLIYFLVCWPGTYISCFCPISVKCFFMVPLALYAVLWASGFTLGTGLGEGFILP